MSILFFNNFSALTNLYYFKLQVLLEQSTDQADVLSSAELMDIDGRQDKEVQVWLLKNDMIRCCTFSKNWNLHHMQYPLLFFVTYFKYSYCLYMYIVLIKLCLIVIVYMIILVLILFCFQIAEPWIMYILWSQSIKKNTFLKACYVYKWTCLLYNLKLRIYSP